DGGGDGRILGVAAMHLHPDFDAVAVGVFADLAQRLADVLDGGLGRHVLGERIGTDLDGPGAGVVRELDEGPGDVALLLAVGWNGQYLSLRRGQQDPQRFFNTKVYSFALAGTHGNAGRNRLNSPGIINLDFSMHKDFALTERHKLRGGCRVLPGVGALRSPT